jgi:trehalose 6-phosphate synthase
MSQLPSELIVLANREPYRHERDRAGRVVTTRCSSGVVNAVEPLLLMNSGVWVGEGIGDEDRRAARDRDGVDVPVDAPRYRLRRVWLTADERRGYYYGFANSALWPLCHRTAIEPTFYADDFKTYELVNRRFANAVAEEARGRSPVVLIQDYHFALVPAIIRRQLPLSRISTFWHIPWPRPETFSICPWSRALLEGLLGSTSIGLQTSADRINFFAAAEQLPGAEIDLQGCSVTYKGRTVNVGVFPASIVWPQADEERASGRDCRAAVRRELALGDDIRMAVGVDRLDYTKGLEHKFLAIERLLERKPSMTGTFVFVQLAEPSRECLRAYQLTRERVLETAARINGRFGVGDWQPIRLLEAHHPAETVAKYLRAADCCYVGSLHDGMNLVGKEFVRERDDERGVLVLSTFAGAAQELTDALLVNPYDVDAAAAAVERALAMPPSEQRNRMRRLRATVAANDAGQWARSILDSVAPAEQPAAEGLLAPIASALAPLKPALTSVALALGAEDVEVTTRPLASSDASPS